MGSFDTDVNIQTLVGILLVAFSLLLVLVGILLMRFRFLDSKSFSFSRGLGKGLAVGGAILAFASLLVLITVRF